MLNVLLLVALLGTSLAQSVGPITTDAEELTSSTATVDTTTTAEPATTAAPTPDIPEYLPVYEFILRGTFDIEGEPNQDCDEAYLDSLRNNQVEIILDVQYRLSTGELCKALPMREQIQLINTDVGMVINGNKGTSLLYYDMEGVGQHRFDDIRSCSSEIQTYIADHQNWNNGQPIEEIYMCPKATFPSKTFADDGRQWKC